jgi:hypothetical protein
LDYTLRIYKVDRRTKTGDRLVGTYTFNRKNDAAMDREVRELRPLYPAPKYRIVFVEKYKTVKSLMTGKDVKIAEDTPWCCNPASETFWSM